MATPILMPQLGEAVVEAVIDRWLVQPGQSVQRYAPLLEVMTDKVNTEIPSPLTGVLVETLAAEGDTVAVGAPIALVQEPEAGSDTPAGATPPAVHDGQEALAANGAMETAPEVLPPPTLFPSSPPVPPTPLSPPTAPAEDGDAPFSPAVRRLAAEHGIDPRGIAGSGAGGRVTREDVVAHAGGTHSGHGRSQAAADVATTPAAAASSLREDAELVRPTALRRTIAARMVQSAREIPHAWMMVEADVTGLVQLRQAARADFLDREGFALTYLPFFVKAVVEGLRRQPLLNAAWTDEGILQHHRIALGVAVAAEQGLFVPVLRNADGLSVAGIARSVHALMVRVRAGDMTRDDADGGTFTVNNTGALGSVLSKPLIPPGHSGIVTLEAIVRRPAVVGEGIAIRDIVNLSLSFDHRVADGLTAARFMQSVKASMEGYAPGFPVY